MTQTEPRAPAAAAIQLTQLSTGLLQLLDLVLQEKHGHCERQQRQQLQLGRHHDSEQPHQIIRGGMGQSMLAGEISEKHRADDSWLGGGAGGPRPASSPEPAPG